MAEKLFSRKNKAGKPVSAGEVIEAKLDGVMCHYGFAGVTRAAMRAGFTEGLPRVWDKDKLFVLVDHHQPAPTQELADRNQFIRQQVERLGITTYHDAEPGIAHQMMIDYGLARPGELVVGTDSHTITYGAINCGATGIPQPEAVYAILFGELWFQVPQSVKVNLEGHHPSYPIAKDIILNLAGQYGDDFGTNLSVEYAGSLIPQLSIDSRMCLSAHGVEIGAKLALFPSDAKTEELLRTTTNVPYETLVADPDAKYERELTLNVDEMPFVVAKPHQFGNVGPVQEARGVKINQAQIGSCANGRFEDIEIAARMLKGRKVAKGVRFIISPASQEVYLQCVKAQLVETLLEAGVQFAGPGCSICQPQLGLISAGEVCITSTTRNYKGRKGSTDASIYLGGPLTVTAAAVAGEIQDPREVFSEL